MVRLASVLLVDRRGHLLLQERDEHAPVFPDRWGTVGGHVEDGEEFEPAAYRELAEETGLALPAGTLTLWREYLLPHPQTGEDMALRVYVASTTATDADIVVGEGRRIIFVRPDAIGDLDLAGTAAIALPEFLDSAEYAALAAG